jgi:anti-anti-sigma factor
VPHDDTTFDEMAYDEAHHHSPSDLVVLGVSGELFYGVSHMLRDQLNSIVRLQRPKRIVVRLRRAYSVDYSCWSALFDFVEAFHAAGGKLYLCGVRRDYDRIIDQAGIRDLLPTRQVYPARESLFAAFQTCVNDVVEDLPADALLAPPWMRYRDLHAPKGLAGSET